MTVTQHSTTHFTVAVIYNIGHPQQDRFSEGKKKCAEKAIDTYSSNSGNGSVNIGKIEC